MSVRLTDRQELVLRLLSLCPGGISMAYLVYSLTGTYPRQVKGEVRSWRSTFEALRRRRRLVERRYDYTHWCWSLSARGLSVTHGWLVRAHDASIR